MQAYGKLCTEYYDLDKLNPPQDALAFYLRYAQMADGLIIEAMSGSGRFLIPMLEQGFTIDGVDASPDMLDACRVKCQAKGLSPQIYR